MLCRAYSVVKFTALRPTEARASRHWGDSSSRLRRKSCRCVTFSNHPRARPLRPPVVREEQRIVLSWIVQLTPSIDPCEAHVAIMAYRIVKTSGAETLTAIAARESIPYFKGSGFYQLLKVRSDATG